MEPLSLPLPAVLEHVRGQARVAVVLGSGFAGLADALENVESFAYADLEGYPRPATHVPGHAGRLLVGDIGGARVAVFSGRVHMYQGVDAVDASWTVRLAHAMGATTVVLTNAAGGVSQSLVTGDVVLIEDHINLTGRNPLIGWAGPEGGVPFVSMSEAYDAGLRRLALEVADRQGLVLVPGTYAGLTGPSFETPAEVRMLHSLGATVVGMSTVVEAITARAFDMRVLGLSLVTNAAAGADLEHEQVLEAGRRAQASLTRFLCALLPRL